MTITGTLAQINALLNTDGTSTVSYIDNTYNPSAVCHADAVDQRQRQYRHRRTADGQRHGDHQHHTNCVRGHVQDVQQQHQQTNQTEIDISGRNSGTATIILTFSGPVTFTGGSKTLTMADGDEVPPGSDNDVATYSASLSDLTHGVLVFTYNPEGDALTHDLAIIAVNGTIKVNGNNGSAQRRLSACLRTMSLQTTRRLSKSISGSTKRRPPAGVAGEPINLALTDLSGGQSGPITVTVTGAPSDWSLDQGTNLGDGIWAVQTSDPAALTIRYSGQFRRSGAAQCDGKLDQC